MTHATSHRAVKKPSANWRNRKSPPLANASPGMLRKVTELVSLATIEPSRAYHGSRRPPNRYCSRVSIPRDNQTPSAVVATR